MGIGNLTGRAANTAADTVTGLIDQRDYPESEYGLAAFLFTRIAQAERNSSPRDRGYYLELMETCLATVRPARA